MDSIEFIDDDFQQEDQVRLTLKDLLALCISKWKWFVISLAVIMGFTVIYLLRQPNVYTRYTSLLIKEEGRGTKSFASELNTSVGMGMFSNRTNVDNELSAFSLQMSSWRSFAAWVWMSTTPPMAPSIATPSMAVVSH